MHLNFRIKTKTYTTETDAVLSRPPGLFRFQWGDGNCLAGKDTDVFVVLDLQLFQDTYWSASVVCV